MKIVGIVILVIVLIGGGLVYTQKDKLANLAVEKGFTAMEDRVMLSLPESVSRESAGAIFSKTLEKIKSGAASQKEIQGVFMAFQSGMRDGSLDSLEVANLLNGLNRLNSQTAEK